MKAKSEPAFIFIEDLRIAVVLNKNAEPIAYSEDPAEVQWLFKWVHDYDKHRLEPGLKLSMVQREDRKRGRISPALAQQGNTPKRPAKRYPVIAASTEYQEQKNGSCKGSRNAS